MRTAGPARRHAQRRHGWCCHGSDSRRRAKFRRPQIRAQEAGLVTALSSYGGDSQREGRWTLALVSNTQGFLPRSCPKGIRDDIYLVSPRQLFHIVDAQVNLAIKRCRWLRNSLRGPQRLPGWRWALVAFADVSEPPSVKGSFSPPT